MQQTGLRIETRRPEVRGAAFVGRDQDAVLARFLGRIGNGASLRVDPLAPVDRRERLGEQALAVGAVQDKEVAVARGLHQHLARLAVEAAIHQHRDLGRIPIVRVVRRNLESPGELPGIRIQRDDAARPRIVAGARRAIQHGRRDFRCRRTSDSDPDRRCPCSTSGRPSRRRSSVRFRREEACYRNSTAACRYPHRRTATGPAGCRSRRPRRPSRDCATTSGALVDQ